MRKYNVAQIDESKPEKLFIPTFENKASVTLWLGLIFFLTIFGVGTSAYAIESLNELWEVFVDIFTSIFFIVMGVVGMIYFNLSRLIKLKKQETVRQILLIILVVTPFATVMANCMEYLIDGNFPSFQELILYMIVNTFMTIILFSLLMFYFYVQYQRITAYQLQYQQRLVEQNEQLKARITPHFFFNLLNTMQYLVENDPIEADAMIQHISKLYRVSFDDTREIAMLDELELCESYLSIEKYRFDKKLIVTWHLPDEDLLYDMVITSLTLQIVIEKLIVLIVENSTETIHMVISVDWQNDVAKIDIEIELPQNVYQTIYKDIHQKLQFNSQIAILRQYFGVQSNIDFELAEQWLFTKIRYPLKDVAAL